MGDARANLIQSTINNAVAASNDNYQFSVESQDTTDPSTWIIYGKIKARAGSPVYNGGYIKIRIELPLGYPFDPPLVYSLHKIFHPNVDEYGQICSDLLQSDDIWAEDDAFVKLTQHLTDLLDTPDLRYPVGAEAAAAYNSEPDQYIAVGRATYESNPIA